LLLIFNRRASLLVVTDSIHDSALDYQSDVFPRENTCGAETWLNATPSAARAATRMRRRAGSGGLFQHGVAAWLPAARFCAARRLNQPASVFFAVLYGKGSGQTSAGCEPASAFRLSTSASDHDEKAMIKGGR